MDMRLLRVLALAGALLAATPHVLQAQAAVSAGTEAEPPGADTLAVSGGLSAEDRMMAKLDSLRQTLADAPERRRQAIARALNTADSLCRVYNFPEAVDVLGSISSETDSTTSRSVEEALLRSHSALRMMSRVSRVRVTARKRISKEEFFRIFPGAEAGGDVRFSASSRNGRTMYFSSKDRSGAGGYDLYVSRRDPRTGAWRESVNLGFPYSSPYNDYLYADTGDGAHSVLVSDRNCPGDSVNVYVLAYDPVPPRQAVTDARMLRSMAALEPASGRPAPPARRGSTAVDMSAYSAKTSAVRTLRDSVSVAGREIDALRAALAEMAEDEREEPLAAILARELVLNGMRGRLDAASRELQEIEQAFLSRGDTPVSSLLQTASEAPADSVSADLFLDYEGGRAVMKLSENGGRTVSVILPEGSFGEYVEFPATPELRVRAVIPEEETLPPLALTVIRMYTGAAPEETVEDGANVYTTGIVSGLTRAESLMMALRATGVTDISLLED